MLSKQEEMILLSVLQIGENAYLVNIRRHLKENAGKDWAYGSIHMVLEKLRRHGFLAAHTGPPQSAGGKPVKYYRLTDEGIEVLETAKSVQDRMWNQFSRLALNRKQR